MMQIVSCELAQGWISDVEIDGSTFGSRFASKNCFFLNCLANFTTWLLDKMFALSKKKSIFVFVSGFLTGIFLNFCANII